MKLSIIIPYYKTFELTKKLLEKLTPQLNSETELIIVNDASDGKEFIEYADVFINRKHNGGVTCSRNDALKIARGEYIAFIDCDDLITEDYVKTILEKINENYFDLCWISWNSPFGNSIATSEKQINIAPWSCILHSNLFDKIKFNEDYNLNEEEEFWGEIFKIKNLKIDFISKIIYNYTIQENSLTRRYNRGEITSKKEKKVE